MYIVLARGKGHKNNAHRDLFKSKKPKQKNPRPPAAFYTSYDACIGLSA